MELMNISLLVQEFYAIEAVYAMLAGKGYGDYDPFRHSHARWYADFTAFRSAYISQFASAIYDYTALVVAAELRHARDKASYYLKGYYTTSQEREEVYGDCTVYDPQDILKAGLKLFDTGWNAWQDSFGGKKWRQIAKSGLMKNLVSDCVFVDHCVDLSHNNSVYFDKGAGIFRLVGKEGYSDFLDFKRICKPQALLQRGNGRLLGKLLFRADNLGILRGFRPADLFSDSFDREESLLLAYQPIRWGKIRLHCTDKDIACNSGFGTDDRYRDEDDDYYDDRDTCAKAA